MELPIIISSLITAGIQLILHWFPWRMLLGRPVPRLMAYGLGVVGIILGMCVWAGMTVVLVYVWWAVGALIACSVSGGVAVTIGYGVDKLVELAHYARTRDTMDQAASKVQ
jgi:hypothetical protein